MKKLLLIAPLPPPTNGQSKASKVVWAALSDLFQVETVDVNKSSLKSGVTSFGRIWEIIKILNKIYRKRKAADVVFLSLAESSAGNLRDLAIYFILRKNLDKLYVQMLGGAGMKKILSAKGWRRKLNEKFLKQMAGVIVEGDFTAALYEAIVQKNKIHILPNFAEDYLFLSTAEITKKFRNIDKIHILFLSNLIAGKGYIELAEAYISLPKEIQQQFEVNFVGGFESKSSENEFLEKIKSFAGLAYLGNFIDGNLKRDLYSTSHIFCLPTYYPYEGQPISILEGYATACAVVTTNHSGIKFIFKNNVNGYLVDKKSTASIAEILTKITQEKNRLQEIALYNNNLAIENYRESRYVEKIKDIFLPESCKQNIIPIFNKTNY